MAEARKCDRCHWFYEIPKEQQNKLKPYEMKGAYAKILLCDNNRDYPETVRWYDLCPNCVKQQPDEDHNSMAQKLKRAQFRIMTLTKENRELKSELRKLDKKYCDALRKAGTYKKLLEENRLGAFSEKDR